ncbi:O-methyltransferase [Acaryochloris marina]|uniref:O-methyltransferase n=1 Tax=Acaryochloris marina TaxID=155978 RepID=UPI0021C4417C|nr:class I SAM-dependent methyltransferase [Acaryochloris marina]BDM77389.1 hypothetical protein AM10699_02630 [Acaryochloris marina MBIC10699]
MRHQNNVLGDPKVEAVLERLHHAADRQALKLFLHYLPQLPRLFLGQGIHWNPARTHFYRDKYIPIEREQGQLLYLLARAINAQTIVEFGSSYGVSTLYLATAIRDNGQGKVIGTEIVPEKVIQARQHIAEAGLTEFVDLREGDALKTLQDIDGSIDLVLIDGYPHLALDILRLLHPQIRQGGLVISDNVGTFKTALNPYVEFLQTPTNGYRSATLPLKGGTELSIKVV